MQVSTLKPGLLVSVKTTIRGGVQYVRTDIEPEHQVGDGRRASWQTERAITDAEEFDAAIKVRSEARATITRVCCPSSFGLLCPEDKEQELTDAIATARQLVSEFNATARCSKVEVFSIAGRIAQDDLQAARAIASEVRDLMRDMEEGIKRADVEAIRKAATAAKAMQGMLSASVADRVGEAITQARSAARELVKRVGKAGELAADVVAELNINRIESARFAFLDLDDTSEEVESVQYVAPAVEFEEVEEVALAAAPAAPIALELF